MSDSRFALIDLGSNTIRLVVFDRTRPLAAPLLNEKTVVELGHGLEQTGVLAADRIEAALQTFARFKWLLDGLKLKETHIIATAAVREAGNAARLIAEIERLMGCVVRVLEGEEEAHFAAQGVLLDCPGASGIVADLGGGSLELAEIGPKGVGRTASLPLGILRLEAKGMEAARAALRQAFTALPWLQDVGQKQQLYLVGGTWRALARGHMVRRAYPLAVLHRYALSAKRLRKYAKRMMGKDLNNLEAMTHVPPSRRRKLPWAALAARELSRFVPAARVVISGAGLREGYSAELLGRDVELRLPQNERYDRTIATLIPDGGRFGQAGQVLFDWTSPIFEAEKEALRNRRRQACQLFDYGWEAHPDYRDSDIPGALLHSAALSQSHKDRAYMALVLLLRHGGDPADARKNTWLRLLDLLPKGHIRHATATGQALRLAYKISKGISANMAKTKLSVEGLQLVLTIQDQSLADMGQVYTRHLNRLAATLGKEPTVRTG